MEGQESETLPGRGHEFTTQFRDRPDHGVGHQIRPACVPVATETYMRIIVWTARVFQQIS